MPLPHRCVGQTLALDLTGIREAISLPLVVYPLQTKSRHLRSPKGGGGIKGEHLSGCSTVREVSAADTRRPLVSRALGSNLRASVICVICGRPFEVSIDANADEDRQ